MKLQEYLEAYKTKTGKDGRGDGCTKEFVEWILSNPIPERLEDVFAEYLKMRKTIRKPATERAQKLILAKLERFAPGDYEKQIKILDQSIENSWQDVYELKISQRPKLTNYLSGGEE